MEEKLNLKLKKSSDLIGELPRPEGRGFKRIEVALRHSPSFAGSGAYCSSPIPQSSLPCGLCLCLNFLLQRGTSSEISNQAEAKSFSRLPRHPRRKRQGFQL